MVAIIHNSSSLRNALHYNENKVKQGVAKFIHSGNYPKDTELLGLSDKINRLERQTRLNQQTKVNSVHISLNFDLSDKLTTEKLKEITDVYMQKIGFAEQPYLVYQHNDAGHPHIHIVTTNIKSDGRRIELHNLARNQSMKANREIEKEYQLVQAQNKKRLTYELKPINVQRVQYGKAETKRAITNVLDHVLSVYKYVSIAELNAVLQQYNVVADRGSENSRIYGGKGLVYRVLDDKRNKIGVPIKSSLIYNKPGLKFLEGKFEQNETARQPDKLRIKNVIDLTLFKNPNHSLQSLKKSLEKEGINTVLRQNAAGIVYGITYVDHRTKSVFNGSDIGKQYTAKGILERCHNADISTSENAVEKEISKEQIHQIKPFSIQTPLTEKTGAEKVLFPHILIDLVQPKQQLDYVPNQLKQTKKKRRQISHRH